VGASDVDHDSVVVEGFGKECRADDESRAMQLLRWAEYLPAE
jgi:hypothetical protein